ncbi:MAG: AAA family ATPase [Acidobacteriota bacterium]
MSSPARPPIGQVFDPTPIPEELKALPRWAVWEAVWNERRQKWDKVPHHPTTGAGLSTKAVAQWCDFGTALDALLEHPDKYAGLGLVLTDATDLIGVDIDGCFDEFGCLTPDAEDILASMSSYAERSPSGRGVRILGLGKVDSDFVNHELGVELYNGHTPRFLTVTGDQLHRPYTARFGPIRPKMLQWLEQTYRRKPKEREAAVISIEVPDLVDDALLPSLPELPHSVRDFLETGVHVDGDNSLALHVAGIQLLESGYTPEECLSILAHAPGSMAVALAHRSQDFDRAVQYLWVEHVQKALPKARTPQKILDDFDDVSEDAPPGRPDGPGEPPTKRPRFELQPYEEFTRARRISWLIKKILPQADLGVIYGESASGKSFYALELAGAVARGIPWRGAKSTQARVVYVTAEGQEDFRKRVRAYARENDLEALPNGGMQMWFVDEAPNLLEVADARALAKQIAGCPGGAPALIILDTLAQVMPGGNENSGEDVGRLLGHCRILSKACAGAMVLLIHHSGKDAARGARGWSGLRGAADFEMEITRDGHDRVATLTKLKGGEDGMQWPFRLKPLVLGQDEDGDDITSCVVEHTDEMPEKKVDARGAAQRAVLIALHQWRDMDGQWPTRNAVLTSAQALLPPPEENLRDRRSIQVRTALDSMLERGELHQDASGALSVPRMGEQP